MEEKKLTDEATIDSLKEMAIKFSKDIYVNRVLVNAINLIHRLQGEVQRLAKVEMEFIGKIAEQKAEIERLTEELATAKQELVNEQRYYENAYSKACQLETQNSELQKQVDELKERAKIDLEHERVWGKIKTKQAVKDTAKEILAKANELWLDTINPNCLIGKIEQWIKERYGVEV